MFLYIYQFQNFMFWQYLCVAILQIMQTIYAMYFKIHQKDIQIHERQVYTCKRKKKKAENGKKKKLEERSQEWNIILKQLKDY